MKLSAGPAEWLSGLWNEFRHLQQSPFVRNMTFFSSSATIAQFMMMVYGILMARILGPESNGLYSAAYSITTLTSFLVNFGMDTWMLRKSGQISQTRSMSGLVISNKLILGSVWLFSLVVIAPGLRPDIYSRVLIVLCTIDVLADLLFATATNALNIDKQLRKISWITLVSRGGRLLSLLLLAALGQTNLTYLLAGRTLATLLGLIWALQALRPVLSAGNLASGLTRRLVLVGSFPYAVSEFLNIIYQNADITMVALMADKTSTGLYAPTSGLIHALFIIPFSISVSIIPVLSRLVESNRPRLYRELWRSVLGLTGIGLGLWGVVGLGGKYFMPVLLGKAYQTTGDLLAILSPILLFKCIEVACSSLLVAGGWQRKRIGPQMIAAGSNVLINLWAIPHWGLNGVSWAYLISELLLMLGYIYFMVLWLQTHKITTQQPA